MSYKDKEILKTARFQEWENHISEALRKGFSPHEIYAELLLEEPMLSEDLFDKMTREAFRKAYSVVNRDREYIFRLHMSRYEEMFKRSIKMEDSQGRPFHPYKDRDRILARYSNAIKALRSKEELLGLHDKSIVVNLMQTTTTLSEPKREGKGHFNLNFEKLSLEEKVELLSLLQQCRTVPIEGVRQVVVKRTTIEITSGNKVIQESLVRPNETIDTVYEEMPEKVVHKLLPSKPEIKKVVERGIKDKRDPEMMKLKRTNSMDIERGIHKKSLEQFEELMKSRRDD